MFPLKVKSSEIIDPFELGKNYIGVGDVGLLSAGTPLRYGFILYDTRYGVLLSSKVILPFPPDAISIDEPAATNITYTQNSGKFIERRGQISKAITISGTTGFNYSPKYGSLVRQFLTPGQIVEGEGPNSGMGRFLSLRNLFRAYHEVFSNDAYVEQRKNVFFIFVNEKDGETWLVEPMGFRMTRNSPRDKFTYRYEITMHTIALVDNVSLLQDPTTLFSSIANALQIAQNISNQISRYAAALGNAIAIISGALREAAEAIVSISNTVSDLLTSLANGSISFIALGDLIKGNASITNQIKNNFIAAVSHFEDVRKAWTDTMGHDPVPFAADEAIAQLLLQFAGLAGRTELYNPPFNSTWSETIKNYTTAYGWGGNNTVLTDPLNKPGVIEAEILPGDDIIKIASRELGNSERFMELVILNNLKPPYVSPNKENRAPNTLAPGDPILVPAISGGTTAKSVIRTTVFTDPFYTGKILVTGLLTSQIDTLGKLFRVNQWVGFTVVVTEGPATGDSRIIVSNTTDTFTVDHVWITPLTTASVVKFYIDHSLDTAKTPQKSANDQLLGTDITLNDGKIVVTSNGDFGTKNGTDNMRQAIELKFNTRPGMLPIHTSFGLGADPGVRATADSLLAYKVAVRQLLLSDSRIDTIQQLKAYIDQDKIYVQAYVTLTGQAQPFAVDTRGGT